MGSLFDFRRASRATSRTHPSPLGKDGRVAWRGSSPLCEPGLRGVAATAPVPSLGQGLVLAPTPGSEATPQRAWDSPAPAPIRPVLQVWLLTLPFSGFPPLPVSMAGCVDPPLPRTLNAARDFLFNLRRNVIATYVSLFPLVFLPPLRKSPVFSRLRPLFPPRSLGSTLSPENTAQQQHSAKLPGTLCSANDCVLTRHVGIRGWRLAECCARSGTEALAPLVTRVCA